MATVTVSKTDFTNVQLSGPRGGAVWIWSPLANGDVGSALAMPMFADRSVHVLGTFGAGGTVVLEGSNVASPSADADWATLTDQSDNALSFTAAKLEAVAPLSLHIRPKVTAGDGTTAITVIVLARGDQWRRG